jgi:predicted PurR-regulated permease PerM
MIRAVLIIALALAAVALVAAASRPLGWLAAAVMVAALLQIPVTALSRYVPRGLAVPIVLLIALGLVGGLAFGVVGDVDDQVTRLERAAPQAAREIERSDRFGEFATEVDLAQRVNDFVDGLPDRLRGGDEVTAIRSAATRGIAFFATLVLTVFLMVSGPGLVATGFEQIPDPGRRERVRALVMSAHARWWRYLVLTLARMLAAGLFAYAVALIVDVPGPVLLALWVGVWSIVPTIGVLVGSIAVALLAAPDSFATVGAVLAFFAAYQVAEDLLVQPRLERQSLHVGAFVTFVAAALGLEVYGIGGLIGAVVLVVFAAAVVREIGLDEDEGLFDAAQEVVGDDSSYRAGNPVIQSVEQEGTTREDLHPQG